MIAFFTAMQKVKAKVLKYLLMLLFKHCSCSVSVYTTWKPKSINGSIFDDPSYQNDEVVTNSEIKCALIANKLKWPNVLYFSSGVCHLATVDLTSCQNVFIQGPSAVEGKWVNRGWYFYGGGG